MRLCPLRTASAADAIEATSLDTARIEHAPWCRTAPAALLIHIEPLGPGRCTGRSVDCRYHRCVTEIAGQSLDHQLEELGAQLAWVREYL
jgi:hypothetical protein